MWQLRAFPGFENRIWLLRRIARDSSRSCGNAKFIFNVNTCLSFETSIARSSASVTFARGAIVRLLVVVIHRRRDDLQGDVFRCVRVSGRCDIRATTATSADLLKSVRRLRAQRSGSCRRDRPGARIRQLWTGKCNFFFSISCGKWVREHHFKENFSLTLEMKDIRLS